MRLLLLASAIFYGNIHGMDNSKCCYSKTVGKYSYTLVNSSMPVPSQCKNDCVYIRNDQLHHLYCFESGELPVQCNHKDAHCLYNPGKQIETLNNRQSESCVSVVRVDCSSIGQDSYWRYSSSLRAIKDYADNDERSFENIANYHGGPAMCNSNLDGLGTAKFCCLNHVGPNFLNPLFTPWHRLYVVQMEQALINATQIPVAPFGVPYWDWTNENEKEIPKLATESEWQNGAIKGQNKHTVRNFRVLNTADLARGVKTAYEQTTVTGFNNHIVSPHNDVHVAVGGSMGSIEVAAYDPIFFLHHSEVDRQYAFWQALQKIRKRPDDLTGRLLNWEMQPFPTDPPNPFALTRDNPTGNDGLDYSKKFCYTYDKLLFQDMTPQQFHAQTESERTLPRLYAGLTIKDMSISSTQYFDLVKGSNTILPEIGYIVTFGFSRPPKETKERNYNIVLYDVTNLLENPTTDPLDQTLHFAVSKYEDIERNPLPLENTYKPTAIYRKANTETYVIRVQVANIELYSPVMKHCHLDSVVEFLNPDGSFSNRVTLESEGTTKDRTINGEFPIKKLKNKFRITKTQRSNESTYINVGYDPECHLQCDPSGVPTTGHPNIYLIPWNLNWIKCHENKVEISSCEYDTVIIAWCSGQQTDIVEVSNKKDFDDCTNLAPTTVAVTDNGHVDGFIAIQNTRRSIGTFYYASQSYCEFGFKIAITVKEC